MKRRRLLAIGFIAFGFALMNPAMAGAQHVRGNEICPVMPGTRVQKKFYADYQGERIYFCCRPCVKAFKKHPERYLKRLKQESA